MQIKAADIRMKELEKTMGVMTELAEFKAKVTASPPALAHVPAPVPATAPAFTPAFTPALT